MKNQDTYKAVKTFVYPNAIVRVHIPDLTEEEQRRRMKRIHAAAADLLRAGYESQKKQAEDKEEE